jgi:lipid-binding SYLF domain-containing protein
MKKKVIWGIALLMAAFFAGQPNLSFADTSQLSAAGTVLQEIQAIPETCIPPQLFHDAYGIAIIPGLIKAGFIVGARYGRGVLAANRGGNWSAPVFVQLGGGSVGFQIGAESTDIILVFKTERSLQYFRDGKFTLGADAAVAAGPVGRHAEAATDLEMQAEIYAYSRSRGLFGGVAIEGAALSVVNEANTAFYGREVSADEILAGRVNVPPEAAVFRGLLQRYSTVPGR